MFLTSKTRKIKIAKPFIPTASGVLDEGIFLCENNQVFTNFSPRGENTFKLRRTAVLARITQIECEISSRCAKKTCVGTATATWHMREYIQTYNVLYITRVNVSISSHRNQQRGFHTNAQAIKILWINITPTYNDRFVSKQNFKKHPITLYTIYIQLFAVYWA